MRNTPLKKSADHIAAGSDYQGAPDFRAPFEISLMLWHEKWMDLRGLFRHPANADKFAALVRALQREGLSVAIARFLGGKIAPAAVKQMKGVYPSDVCGMCYEFKLRGKGSSERVFMGIAKHEEQKMYLLYVDPHHKMCP